MVNAVIFVQKKIHSASDVAISQNLCVKSALDLSSPTTRCLKQKSFPPPSSLPRLDKPLDDTSALDPTAPLQATKALVNVLTVWPPRRLLTVLQFLGRLHHILGVLPPNHRKKKEKRKKKASAFF